MTLNVRRQARQVALQALYEYDTAQHDVISTVLRHTENRRLAQSVTDYANELTQGVLAHLAELDTAIADTAHDRPLSQMARIDKNILRLAIYEILYNNAVPAKAAINEAVELAKTFGSDTSSRFVNGVLGAIISRSHETPATGPGNEAR